MATDKTRVLNAAVVLHGLRDTYTFLVESRLSIVPGHKMLKLVERKLEALAPQLEEATNEFNAAVKQYVKEEFNTEL